MSVATLSQPNAPTNGKACSSPSAFAVYTNSPMFQMAVRQLESVAEVVNIDPNVLERLSLPKRAMIVSIPVRMDDDHTEVFIGYRVQHSLTSGPSK